jgi:predicted GNAT family acetyltransferase
MTTTVAVVNNEARSRFEADLGGAVAFADYRLRDGALELPHTVVPDAFSGHGVASQLARAALTYARERGLRVIPSCSFMAHYIAKHPEWRDIVHPAWRAALVADR